MMLLSVGAPLTPAGGSSWSLQNGILIWKYCCVTWNSSHWQLYSQQRMTQHMTQHIRMLCIRQWMPSPRVLKWYTTIRCMCAQLYGRPLYMGGEGRTIAMNLVTLGTLRVTKPTNVSNSTHTGLAYLLKSLINLLLAGVDMLVVESSYFSETDVREALRGRPWR